MIVVIIIAVLSLTFGQLWFNYNEEWKALEGRLKSAHSMFGPQMGDAYFNADLYMMNQIEEGVLNDPLIVGVAIFDDKSGLHRSKGQLPVPVSELGQFLEIDKQLYKIEGTPFIGHHAPVFSTDFLGVKQRFGYLFFFTDQNLIIDKIMASAFWVFLNALVTVTVLAGIFMLILHKTVLAPLKTFSHRITEIQIEDPETTKVDLGLEKENEIFVLQERFNDLMARLGATLSDLNTLKKNLEKKVFERTVDLQSAVRTAEDANRTKSRLLAAAGHDLRQPIQAMALLATVLQEEIQGDRKHDLLNKMQGALRNLGGMLDSLLDMSRLENHAIVPQVKDFPAKDLLVQMQAEFEPLAVGKDLTLSVDDSDLTLSSDFGLLARIIGNFLSNAIRYTDQGVISVSCRAQGKDVRLEVRDTGRGIKTENLRQMFSPYIRLEDARMQAPDGLGLGLSIADGLARLLGHRIEVVSTPGEGSVFTVTVPMGDALAPPSEARRPDETISSPFYDQTFLVIDDDPEVLDAMQILLEGWGGNVIAARNLAEAVSGLKKASGEIQALISDFHLAGNETGLDVREALTQEIGHDIPTIIISGDTDPQRRRDVEALGCLFLTKPVQPVSLRPAMRRLLAS